MLHSKILHHKKQQTSFIGFFARRYTGNAAKDSFQLIFL